MTLDSRYMTPSLSAWGQHVFAIMCSSCNARCHVGGFPQLKTKLITWTCKLRAGCAFAAVFGLRFATTQPGMTAGLAKWQCNRVRTSMLIRGRHKQTKSSQNNLGYASRMNERTLRTMQNLAWPKECCYRLKCLRMTGTALYI